MGLRHVPVLLLLQQIVSFAQVFEQSEIIFNIRHNNDFKYQINSQLIYFQSDSTNTNRANQGNLYYKTLSKLIEQLGKQLINNDTLLLEEGFKITDSILSKIDTITIIKVNQKQINRLAEKRKPIILYRICPMDFYDNEFVIRIEFFRGGYNIVKRKYFMGYSGNFVATFTYDGSVFKQVRFQSQGF